MTKFSKKDFFVNHLKLHTEAFGKSSNPACILIAGKMSTARFWTDAFCQYLANQGFYVIRYDHRDGGESSEIDWQKAPYTMSDLAKDAISVIDGYGIKKAHFIGDSMGGWICQRIGVDYPEKVLSLVIISAGPIEITKEGLMDLTAAEQEFLDRMTKMFLSVKNGKTVDETVQNLLPVWRHANAEIPFDEEMAKAFTIDFLTRTKNKNAKNHDLMMQEFLAQMKQSNTLSKINRPVLVIHGDKDPIVLLRHGQAVADAIPNSRFVVIYGMGHVFFNHDLEKRIAQLVVDHLKNHRKESTS
jgi:pimeloyl-ACP methyl ester carboxylesterase